MATEYDEDTEDIPVTSPTSLHRRDSIRRSMSSNDMGYVPPAVALRSVTGGERRTSTSRHSFFGRAPPPPPPSQPPQIPVAQHSQQHHYGGDSRVSISNGMMPRASSNPSLAALNETSDSSNPPPYHHGYSLGPNSAGSTPMGSSSRMSTTQSFMSRRGSTRKSILSVLTREKEVPPSIPEGPLPEISCEGFLTKRGHVFTNWKMRYFVLRGNVLEYFSGEDKSKRYGSVIVEKVAPWSGEAHGFMFFTTKQVPYYVYASSESERSKWLRAMKEFYVEQELTCEGYLTRRGHLVPSQRHAYYVLNGTSLRHFSDQQAYRDNQLAIAEVEVRSVAPWDNERNGLMFLTVTGNVFYAIADSTAEQQRWLASVKKATANVPEPISCSGYLTKQGHKRKSWKKRYFVLRGHAITYYTDYDTANSSKGKPLAEVVVEDVQRWVGEPFGFMFMTTEQVPYYVYADNERERTKWMNALRKLTSAGGIEEAQAEKKRCPNCSAVLTGSRFCGACGFNLRGTSVGERGATAAKINAAARNTAETAATVTSSMDRMDDGDPDDENNAFDELEALSEGARTLLLAVMQTPEGIDVGGDAGFPSRNTTALKGEDVEDLPPPLLDDIDDDEADDDGMPIGLAIEEDEVDEPAPVVYQPAKKDRASPPPAVKIPNSPIDSDRESAASPLSSAPPTPPAPKVRETHPSAAARLSTRDVKPPQSQQSQMSRRNSPPPQASKSKLTPNFKVVENTEVKNSSFTSFGGDSEEEEKAEPKPIVPVPAPLSGGVSDPRGVLMGAMGRRVTVGMLAMEDSSDDEEEESKLPTKPPTNAFDNESKREEDDDVDDVSAKRILAAAERPRRKSSADSLELDTRGLVAFDEPAPQSSSRRTSQRTSMTDHSNKNDLYHFIEKELDFTPLFVPSAESIVRCRLYSSMAYASATKVLLFISDSGPLGLWRQDPTDQTTTVNHKWSMVRYLSRAQEEGYGIVLCNPFSNTAVVYEAGGFEREVPVPNSSTPRDHVLFVWEHYVAKCKGDVSVIAFARGGALMKSILEVHEESAREKIHRIAFIETKHEIDPDESLGMRELLGRRAINWEASYESQGGQMVESQYRVGCVCLSIGYMPPNSLEPQNSPTTLEKAEDPAFAFLAADPEQQGMRYVVKWVLAELRRRRHPEKSTPTTRGRRNSNILVIGEANANAEENSSDVSNGDNDTQAASPVPSGQPQFPKQQKYYLPKPSPKQKSSPTTTTDPRRRTPPPGSSGAASNGITVAKDFDLLQVVGQGGFGKVFLAKKRTPPHQGECYAMKVLKKQHVISSGLVNTTMAERQILTEIRHPFVVRLHYAFQDASKLYLVMDYLSGGSLAAHLRRRRKFPEEWARFYAAEVAAAMAHLHQLNIIYRDAKLENVLLDHEGHVRITDFGLSKVGVSDLVGAKTFCGTAAYIAPELLKGQSYGKAADWWSFGILLYEMIGGKPPYYHRNRDIMFQTILKQEWVRFTSEFSDDAVALIRGLLTRDPTQRLGSGPRGADEVLNHPFFDSIDWPQLLERRVQPPFSPGVGKLDTHYAPRLNNNEITNRDRQGSVQGSNRAFASDFDGFSFVGRPSLASREDA